MFIQELRGPNFIHFWPPSPIEWTTTYPLFMWPSVEFLLTTYLSVVVYIVIQWPLSSKVLRKYQRYLTRSVGHSRVHFINDWHLFFEIYHAKVIQLLIVNKILLQIPSAKMNKIEKSTDINIKYFLPEFWFALTVMLVWSTRIKSHQNILIFDILSFGDWNFMIHFTNSLIPWIADVIFLRSLL